MNYISLGKDTNTSKETYDITVKQLSAKQIPVKRRATSTVAIKSKYSDIAIKGDNLINHDSVMQGIHNILHTRVGERIFNRKFGSRIEDFLFEPFTFLTTRMILSELIGAITRNDSRIDVITQQTDVKMNEDTRTYAITVAIKIRGLDDVLYYNDSLSPKEKK